MTVTRRRLLLAGAGGVGAAALAGGTAVGWGRIAHAVERRTQSVPEPRSSVPRVETGGVVTGEFVSAARGGRRTGWSVAYPPHARHDATLPVALVLHARTTGQGDAFGSHHLDLFLASVVLGGTPPFALAAVDGGDHSYWHRRRDGEDPQRMILDEFLPMLARRGLRTERIGLNGWSMGGYGALLLAERLGRRGCAAVAADSPALWLHADDSAPGAFDDADDFRRNDVFAGRYRLTGVPTRIAIGTSDPFYAATRVFIRGLPSRPATDIGPGGHTLGYWLHTAPGQLRFLGRALAAAYR